MQRKVVDRALDATGVLERERVKAVCRQNDVEPLEPFTAERGRLNAKA